MELSLFYNGGNFYEGDIIRVYYWSKGERTMVHGRLHKINSDDITVDYSNEYNSRKAYIEFDDITHIELLKGRL